VKLTMPVLAVGGEKSFGPLQAVIMRHVATNVREVVVAGSGHWLMEERPAETVELIRNFLDSPDAEETANSNCYAPAEASVFYRTNTPAITACGRRFSGGLRPLHPCRLCSRSAPGRR